MKLTKESLALLAEFEGFSSVAYIPVPGDVPTIGYGFTKGVRMGDTMTRAEADARLKTEVKPYEDAVRSLCTKTPNQNEFDAMVLLCYNIGIAGFKRSTVLKAHNAGNPQAAARAYGLWNKSGGKVYRGLTIRRAKEAAVHLTPVAGDYYHADAVREAPPDAMPQTVDPESRMSESPINRAGVVAGGTATVATVAETARTLADVKYSTRELGDWLLPIALVVIAGLCGYMVWQRYKQRKEGWA